MEQNTLAIKSTWLEHFEVERHGNRSIISSPSENNSTTDDAKGAANRSHFRTLKVQTAPAKRLGREKQFETKRMHCGAVMTVGPVKYRMISFSRELRAPLQGQPYRWPQFRLICASGNVTPWFKR
jgi:hypothetical protein